MSNKPFASNNVSFKMELVVQATNSMNAKMANPPPFMVHNQLVSELRPISVATFAEWLTKTPWATIPKGTRSKLGMQLGVWARRHGLEHIGRLWMGHPDEAREFFWVYSQAQASDLALRELETTFRRTLGNRVAAQQTSLPF